MRLDSFTKALDVADDTDLARSRECIETLQRLYDPNGMAGTNDLYHCQMTLVDGSVITTCPQTFDQTQRSAEASKNGNNQQQIIRRYRVSEHVYIIQTICGDRVETQKIFTSYE